MINIDNYEPQEIVWQIKGNQSISSNYLYPLLSESLQDSGEAIIRKYRSRGILAIKISIEGTTTQPIMIITEGIINAQGYYARYLPEGEILTQDILDIATVRARAEANANNERLMIRIGKVDDDGQVDVFFEGKPSTNDTTNIIVSASSFGPRLLGSNVLSLHRSELLGSGMQWDITASKSIASLNAESRGGYYYGISGGFSMANPWGLWSIRANHIDFKVGGINLRLNQHGSQSSVVGEWSFPLNQNITPFINITHTNKTSELRVANWSDNIDFTEIATGIRVQKHIPNKYGIIRMRSDLSFATGIGGGRSLNAPVPLLGAFNNKYQSTKINANVSIPISNNGALVQLDLGLQRSSKGTPSSAQFHAGGPGRGISYNAGILSGPSGSYGSLQFISAPLDKYIGLNSLNNTRAFIGFDGSSINSTSISSAHVGLRTLINNNISASIGYATPMSGPSNAKKSRFTFILSKEF